MSLTSWQIQNLMQITIVSLICLKVVDCLESKMSTNWPQALWFGCCWQKNTETVPWSHWIIDYISSCKGIFIRYSSSTDGSVFTFPVNEHRPTAFDFKSVSGTIDPPAPICWGVFKVLRRYRQMLSTGKLPATRNRQQHWSVLDRGIHWQLHARYIA